MTRRQSIIDTEEKIDILEKEIKILKMKKSELRFLKNHLVDLKGKKEMMDYYKIKNLDQENQDGCIRVIWFYLGLNWGYRVPDPYNKDSVKYWTSCYYKRTKKGAYHGFIDLKKEDYNNIENWLV